MESIIEDHAEDPRIDTADCSIDDVTLREYSQTAYGLLTPGRGRKRSGVIGWVDLTQQFNELTDTSGSNVRPPGDLHATYHPEPPRFLTPYQDISDYFRINPYTTADPFTRVNWGSLDNAYTPLPDYLESTVPTQDPTDLHDDQAGLSAFEDATQAEVNPEAIDPLDASLDDLPAFIDADDRDDCLGTYNPNKNSGTMQCDHCGEEHPWYRPLERGVRSLRPGGITNGTREFKCCDPVEDEVRSCETCGCPRCNALGISHRSTKTPAYRCNTCKLEFSHPIDRTTADGAERARLFWLCRNCNDPTRAPFAGIPEDLLDD